jgi:hypothetical protein
VPDATRVPIVTPEDDQVVGGNGVPMKLGALTAVLEGVVRPSGLACAPVDRMDNPIAGADERELARDRGRREDSATRFVLPQDLAPESRGGWGRILCG